MNFYSLPILINDRRELELELNAKPSDGQQQFVVEVPNLSNFNLLSIPRSSVLHTFVEQTSDISAGDLDMECSLSKDQLEVHLRLQSAKVDKFPLEEEEQKKMTFEELEDYKPLQKNSVILPTFTETQQQIGAFNEHIQLRRISNAQGLIIRAEQRQQLTAQPFDKNTLQVQIFLHLDEQCYSHSFFIHFAHPSEFVGIALDFGSESSQMAIKRYATDYTLQEKRPHIENLFSNILTYHKSMGWFEEEETFDFYQEEKGTKFYKSLFFLRHQLSGNYGDLHQEEFVKDIPKDLRLLVNTSSFRKLFEQRFHQLPNLKILQQHDDVLRHLEFSGTINGGEVPVYWHELKTMVYNSILKVMIESFMRIEFIKSSTAHRYLRLMLLVPNNYDTADIIKIQQQLDHIFRELANGPYAGRLKAWEVLTISESDAAFIGYMNKSNTHVERNKDYIIVDAGKGTTDFSIIRTGEDNLFNLTPVYRNGFAGAGNLITYSLFETLLHYIRHHQNPQVSTKRYIREKILAVLQSDDLKRRNDFYAQLERLKQNFVEGSAATQTEKEWANARSGDITLSNIAETNSNLEVLTDLLSGIEHSTDLYGYVEETCGFIANQVVQYLKLIKDHKEGFDCAGVILTGRAFLFKPLADQLKQKLETEMSISPDKVVQLQGTELKEVCIKGVFNNSITLNAEKTGYPIQVIPATRTQEIKETLPTKEKPKTWSAQSIFSKLFNDLSKLEAADKILSFDHQLDFNRLQQSTLLIGSKSYKVMGQDIFTKADGKKYEVDLAFTNRGYVLRKLHNGELVRTALLQEVSEDRERERSLVVPSLLPVYIDEMLIASLQRDDIRPAKPSPTEGNHPLYF